MMVSFIIKVVMFLIIIGRFSLDVATNFSNFSPMSPPSFNDGQRKSGLMPSPVSGDTQQTPTRIALSPSKVQVFLSFRGEKLRYNFVSHLSDALQRNKINFFIDKNELRGKDLENLFVRIQESRIALVIFSTRYSESKWCMNELVEMNKLVDQKKLIVIPIFYKVKDEDVRKPRWDSEFGRNFLGLAETSNPGEIKEWKKALVSICNKMGLPVGEKSSESDCIKDIVKELRRVIEELELEDKKITLVKKKLRRKADGQVTTVCLGFLSFLRDVRK